MQSSKKKKTFITGLFLVVAFILIFVSIKSCISSSVYEDKPENNILSFDDNWNISTSSEQLQSVNLKKAKLNKNADGTTVYTKNMSNCGDNFPYLSFETYQANVKVYIDDVNIYDSNVSQRKLSGNVIHIIKIPTSIENCVLKIETTASYHKYQKHLINRAFIGDRYELYSHYYNSGAVFIIVSILSLIVSIFCLMTFIFSRTTKHSIASYLYFSLLMLSMSLWIYGLSGLTSLYIKNNFFLGVTDIIVQEVITILMMALCARNLKKFKILSYVAMGYIFFVAIQLLLVGIGIDRAFYIMSQFIEITTVFVMIPVYVGIIRVKAKSKSFKGVMILNSSIYLVIIMAMILYKHIFREKFAWYAITISTGLYCLSAAYLLIRKLVYHEKDTIRERVIFEMAFFDSLTKLPNRNLFNKKINLYNSYKKQDYGFVMFDLNNLKNINDNFGHHYGDKYIYLVASLLEKYCKPYGDVYRIGGDEFVLITTKLNEDNYLDIIKPIEKAVDNLELGQGWRACCAYGFAKYDRKLDQNLQDTLKRADAIMYKTKRTQKKEYNPLDLKEISKMDSK